MKTQITPGNAAGRRYGPSLLFFLLVCWIAFVSPWATWGDSAHHRAGTPEKAPGCPLTPSQEYAGELLSYLLKVVLGRAGNPGSRDEWKRCGTFERLDLNTITRKMTDSGENLSDVMVIDANILALSRVAFYYDHRLSFYKNRDSVSSIYPSPELLGIRLLLLKKLQKGGQINLSALVQRESEIIHQRNVMPPGELKAMNLSPDEMQLVLDIIYREPHYFQYLKSPFLVSALQDLGVVRSDAFTQKKSGAANYRKYPCRAFAGSEGQDAIKIALLPSMTREFYRQQGHDSEFSPFGFKPTPFLADMARRIKKGILSRTKTLLHMEWLKRPGGPRPMAEESWETVWQKILRERIAFIIQDQRPLVIYPGNAQRIVDNLRPSADFAVIVLGENVYLSMDIQEKDRFPRVNRIYVDIMDIKHSQVQEEVDQVSRFIVSRLRDYLMTM